MYFIKAFNVYYQIALLSTYLNVSFTVFLPIFAFITILNPSLCCQSLMKKKNIADREVKAKEVSEKVMHEIIMVYKLANCRLFGRRT